MRVAVPEKAVSPSCKASTASQGKLLRGQVCQSVDCRSKQSSAKCCREFLRGRGCQRSCFPFMYSFRQLRGQLREGRGVPEKMIVVQVQPQQVFVGSFVRVGGAREAVSRFMYSFDTVRRQLREVKYARV